MNFKGVYFLAIFILSICNQAAIIPNGLIDESSHAPSTIVDLTHLQQFAVDYQLYQNEDSLLIWNEMDPDLSLVYKKISSQRRPAIWYAASGGEELASLFKRLHNIGLLHLSNFNDLVKFVKVLKDSPSDIGTKFRGKLGQLETDLPRSGLKDADAIQNLKNIMEAYLVLAPQFDYVQGMTFFPAAMLRAGMKPDMGFWTFASLMFRHKYDYLYADLNRFRNVSDALMESDIVNPKFRPRFDENFWRHFVDSTVGPKWFASFFSKFPFPDGEFRHLDLIIVSQNIQVASSALISAAIDAISSTGILDANVINKNIGDLTPKKRNDLINKAIKRLQDSKFRRKVDNLSPKIETIPTRAFMKEICIRMKALISKVDDSQSNF